MTPSELYHTIKQTRDEGQCLAIIQRALLAEREAALAEADRRVAKERGACALLIEMKVGALMHLSIHKNRTTEELLNMWQQAAQTFGTAIRARATATEAGNG